MKFTDLIGQKFGRLTPIKYIGKNKHGQSKWLCLCGCGNKKEILGYHLTTGNTKSCGCYCKSGDYKIKHGHSRREKQSKTYLAWKNMNQRCNNSHRPDYKYYKNIKVCYRWSNKNPHGFENFLKDIGEIPQELTLDRINNNKGYYPNNYRLVNMKIQCNNRRNDLIFTFNNKTQHLIDWSKEYNINYSTLYGRIFRYKMSIEKALITPLRRILRSKK
jgi:hypothetical protein